MGTRISLSVIMVISIFFNIQLYADIYDIPQKQVMENQNSKVLEVKKTTDKENNRMVFTREESIETETVDNSLDNKKEIINKNFVEVTKGVGLEAL